MSGCSYSTPLGHDTALAFASPQIDGERNPPVGEWVIGFTLERVAFDFNVANPIP
jgi:hypothetical protein